MSVLPAVLWLFVVLHGAAGGRPPVMVRHSLPVTEDTACTLVKAHVAAVSDGTIAQDLFYDRALGAGVPADYHVLALRSRRDCQGICSTSMGWFAVDKVDGRLFAWDVGEMRVGQALGRAR